MTYRNALLVDDQGQVTRDGLIVTEGDRIVAAGSERTVPNRFFDGSTAVDLEGRYVVPGLIDSHQHVATPPNMGFAAAQYERDVYSGITLVRDMADDLRTVSELARASSQFEITAPEILFAALVAGPSFFGDPRIAAASRGWIPGTAPWMQSVTAESDMRDVVALARGTGAHALKIYADLDPAVVARLGREARRQGLQVWAHGAVFPSTPSDVLASHPGSLSHARLLAYEGQAVVPDRYHGRESADAARFRDGLPDEVEDVLRRMSAQGVVLDATLLLDHSDGAPTATFQIAARITARAHELGVAVSAGTDNFASPEAEYSALHDELELLVHSAGFSPLEALNAATRGGALAAGLAAEVGAVQAGYRADFIALERNPLVDVRGLRSVALTVKRGRQYWRSEFDASARAHERIEEEL